MHAACSSSSDIFDLKVGDCLNSSDITSEQVLSIEAISCNSLHDMEIFAATQLDEGDFPGRDAASSAAESFCHSQFEAFVGTTYEQSELTVNWIYPTADSWDTRNDRQILCLLQSPSPISGSLAGAAR